LIVARFQTRAFRTLKYRVINSGVTVPIEAPWEESQRKEPLKRTPSTDDSSFRQSALIPNIAQEGIELIGEGNLCGCIF